jgi:hypothetical protein
MQFRFERRVLLGDFGEAFVLGNRHAALLT